MTAEQDREIAETLSKLLLDFMMLTNPPEIPARFAASESLQTLRGHLISLRDFLFTASNGDLSGKVPLKGFIAGALKTLQANLRHLTWQTKMVATGDFSQRVDFMGEFSESFNAMVVQLDQTLKELMKKEKELSLANEELVREIAVREKTEAALRESEKALRLQAITDSLTGLFNRRHFFKIAETEISKALRYSRPLSVMMYDIDFFKRINDTFGHLSGDTVLQTVAEVTTGELRDSDIPARYGGEEFIALLPETSASEAVSIAERLRRRMESTPVQTGNNQISFTVSFGISDYRGTSDAEGHETALSEFISGADQALYESKNAGRNRVTVFRPADASPP
jgi:diguanylate cyclase (GGDEF)-like protein